MLKKSGDTLIQVQPERYHKRSYDSRVRFASYWHQIDEILSLGEQSILEIGVGNGFVNQYLRRMGRQVVTVDIDLSLAPNIVGSVSRLPFLGNSFPVINVCEVLEHLPYSDFVNALEEINRVTRQYVVLSVYNGLEN